MFFVAAIAMTGLPRFRVWSANCDTGCGSAALIDVVRSGDDPWRVV